ncbi:hypothetical protein [Microbacterium lacticum]|uniref:M23 family metallopeptidase n=1 Tax=Microbacterium lacticum TaxID=33885 RepID=UPI0028D70335|nr:hypothetical protein [Microbacterium lacticum]
MAVRGGHRRDPRLHRDRVLTMMPIPFPASTISLAYGAVDGEFYTFSSPHQGTDFSSRSQGVTAGTAFRASGPGRVVRSGVGPSGVSPSIDRPNSLAGNSIDVDYGDFIARYMHRPYDSPSPSVGAATVEGTMLGVVGATGLGDGGAHLHMETWSKATGRRVNPANYFDYSRVVDASATAGINSKPFDPEEDDMYDTAAQKALFAKIEAETRPYRTYQLGSGLILMGPGGATWTIPSGAYQGLLIAWGLTSATVQRVIDQNELAALRSIHAALSPDPRDAQVEAILSLSDADVARIAAAVPDPIVTLTTSQLAQVAEAAREGGADAIKGLSFVVTPA